MLSYVEYVKEFIKDHLPGYEGQMVYGADLGYKITEGINTDGTATYNRIEAMDYIREWWWEAAEVYDYQKDNYGEITVNPFDNPEAWMVCMIIEGVNAVLDSFEIVNDFWNDNTELTEDLIKEILEAVDNVSEINF